MKEHPTMSKAAYKAEIRALWGDLERLMYEISQDAHAERRGVERKHGPARLEDHNLSRWAPGQGEMERLLDKLAKDCRRHRRAPGAPSGSDWRCSVEEDGFLMLMRFIARAEPGPWAPSADWTPWGAYGDAIGAVLGDRRPAEWIERVKKIDDEPRYIITQERRRA